jgi:hypothetical protein
VQETPNQYSNVYDYSKGGAWYAANYYCVNSTNPAVTVACSSGQKQYVFPVLDSLFGFGTSGSMGLQQDALSETTRESTLHKTQTGSDVTTQESAIWTDTMNRQIVTQDNLCKAGDSDPACAGQPEGYEKRHTNPQDFVNLHTEPLAQEVTGSMDKIEQTNK